MTSFFSGISSQTGLTLLCWLQAGCNTRSIFKQSTVSLNSESSFSQTDCPTKVKVPNLLYYIFIAGWRRDRFKSFQRELAWSEIQTALSRIWNWVTKSIPSDVSCYSITMYKVLGQLFKKKRWKPLKLDKVVNHVLSCCCPLSVVVLHTFRAIRQMERKLRKDQWKCLINWLILMAYQSVKDHFISRGYGIIFIIYSYVHFFCSCFFRGFFWHIVLSNMNNF